jgi:hypothetical protein
MKKDQNNDDDNLNNTMSPLAQAAMQMHEMYTELRNAGFTRQEALYITVKMATGGPEE